MPASFKLNDIQGNSARTYVYENKAGSIFFVKQLNPKIIFQTPEKELRDRMVEEFVTLKIMSLLGLKTPAELLLLENPKTQDLILIKRKAADKEENKEIVEEKEGLNQEEYDKDSLARRAFVIDVLGISDLGGDVNKNSAEIMYKDEKKSRRLIDYDPLLHMGSEVLSFGKTIDYLSKDKEDGAIMPKKEFVKALRKTRVYFLENEEEIYDTLDIIKEDYRKEFLRKRLELMKKMLVENVSQFSAKEIPVKELPDASFYLARQVKATFDFEEFKTVLDSQKIFSEVGNLKVVEKYSVSDSEVPPMVAASKLKKLQQQKTI